MHYNIETLGKENQLNYFIYLYMLYCNLALARGKKVLTFYESFVELLRNLQSTTHVQSKLWILEIMALYAERIMANKDLHM